MKTSISQRILILAKEYGTQDKFAAHVGISRGAVSNFTNGTANPSYDILSKIADSIPTLNCRWLLTGDGDMYGRASELEEIKMLLKTLKNV